ncbi:MAG: hypothetical protein UU73_C0003G0148 [Candidatus Daviesbacteria bacterium GW2011_GWA1_41_61]|uniref:histidine kinase n=1 Tax=Candidatus Daviesbacteria bacterium GW2011_GWA2_40_9 TaxID=1618424 RepID=A0A0G0WFU7_9BACT|nr:MAG: hypothetical protein UU26_C0003G0078 [Candidatus Daviesbacteria bacterium GW2011_GWC1_40_9]KKR83155.1 MAG: hypothetical protein UU29_C0007G0025 [Candidatus Daviesbacteria bacterium GW2011_GWA2_40_9]KKR93502.1 MAG: hypothetical protein UU44_C0002G0163 [Candidatus Daviesbacteria bacterium GW2011_GWB1_41_15]KKS14949.1 MAG: hypothetical protein UU73_C0003G0148 [Candidatus Daviesbacteria bacterium GW2011_GWA1_41_61]
MHLPFLGKNPLLKVTVSTSGIRIPVKKESLETLWRLVQVMLVNLEFENVAGKVVNSALDEFGYLKLGYRIIVLTLFNESTGFLERVAISSTPEAKKALELTPVAFKDIKIPIHNFDNLCIKAMKDKQIYRTYDWYDILRPVYTKEQAEIVQKAVGIKSSMVYPLIFQGRPIGVLIFSMIKDFNDVTEDEKDLLSGFADLVGLAVRNSILFTSLKTTTSQLQVANTKLQELDQLKDDFVSVASHELRTPMTAIKSYLWMALKRPDAPLSEKMNKYLDRAYISTERLINLVNDMLNVSRIEAGSIEIRPSAFALDKLTDDVLAEVNAKASEKSVSLHVLQSQIPQVFADQDKVHQVLLNLVGNSLKFTPEGGSITISFFSDGKTVETSIKDSGVGMSKDDLSRLFQKFGRLDNSYVAAATSGGTGLGLFISKSLVELMGGKIWARSEGVGKGSTFTFSLPVATPEVLSKAEQFTKKVTPGEVKTLEPVAI